MLRFSILILSAIALGGLRALLRHRHAKKDGPPKLDPVSSDWLAQARSRHEHTP